MAGHGGARQGKVNTMKPPLTFLGNREPNFSSVGNEVEPTGPEFGPNGRVIDRCRAERMKLVKEANEAEALLTALFVESGDERVARVLRLLGRVEQRAKTIQDDLEEIAQGDD